LNVTAFGSTSDHLVELSKTVKTPLKTLCEVASGAFFNVQIDFQGWKRVSDTFFHPFCKP